MARGPAAGRRASAAWADVRISVMPLGMQGRRRGDHDRQADECRDRHPDIGVEADALDGARGLFGRADEGLALRLDALVLGLLARLPEEQEGADRGAEDGDDGGDVIPVEGQRGDHPGGHIAPRHVGQQNRRDIGQQRQRGPFEDGDVARVLHEDLQPHAQYAEQYDIQQSRPADQQRQRIPHDAEVGGELDGVGDQQQPHPDIEQPGRIVAPDVAGKPVPRRPPDPRADLLDHDHQRVDQRHQPAQRIAEPGSGLGIGRDGGGIVVGRAADQTGPEGAEEAWFAGPDDRVGGSFGYENSFADAAGWCRFGGRRPTDL